MTAIVAPPPSSPNDHGALDGLEDNDHPQYTLGTGEIRKIHGPLTQVEYDALASPEADTLYVIVGP